MFHGADNEMKRLTRLLTLVLVATLPFLWACDIERSGSQRVTVNPFNSNERGMFYPTNNHRSWEGEPMDFR